MKYKNNLEIEAKFLEVGTDKLIRKLSSLKAEDLGVQILKEIIFYDQKLSWKKTGREFVRLRSGKLGIYLTYKKNFAPLVDGTEEIEFQVSSVDQAKLFLERVGLVKSREQEKRRHSFKLGTVKIDIDTWPKVPTYVELEGPSKSSLQQVAEKLGLSWADAVFENTRKTLENRYHIPIGSLKYFTFRKIA